MLLPLTDTRWVRRGDFSIPYGVRRRRREKARTVALGPSSCGGAWAVGSGGIGDGGGANVRQGMLRQHRQRARRLGRWQRPLPLAGVVACDTNSFAWRKLKGSKTSTKISECIPSFCTVYVVSKGKLSFMHSYT
ncbi:unnamed protein product [Triticum turgidum subsp. durum]|uniref:Uncharacterized protein n=1 Tax=Triticum turgidum subsp. durum TaxID=4567 RepID=A0A9R1AB12_TRITD|nr:unnamed protein product [Triticum turgidum subsp. durum]